MTDVVSGPDTQPGGPDWNQLDFPAPVRLGDPAASDATDVFDDDVKDLSWRDKAIPRAWYGRDWSDVRRSDPHLGDLPTPSLTLDRAALRSNLASFHSWCAERGLGLAPHGKTSMAPAIWRAQIEAGACGITLANIRQARVAREFGVRNIVIANQLLDQNALTWVAGELEQDPAVDFLCWVDSPETVELMERHLQAGPSNRPIKVLVEVGAPGARTGVRDPESARATAQAVTRSAHLSLAGVAGFEGVLVKGVQPDHVDRIDNFLALMAQIHMELRPGYEVEHPVLSAGGSIWFDRVAEVFGPHGDDGTRILLRSGCYAIHDDGVYQSQTPRARADGPQLRSAAHVWSRVLSTPQDDRAYLDAGKRDLSFDEGYPRVQGFLDGVSVRHTEGDSVYALSDQHAHVQTSNTSDLSLGTVAQLGISHPCTTMDKWGLIPVIDDVRSDNPRITGLVRTYF